MTCWIEINFKLLVSNQCCIQKFKCFYIIVLQLYNWSDNIFNSCFCKNSKFFSFFLIINSSQFQGFCWPISCIQSSKLELFSSLQCLISKFTSFFNFLKFLYNVSGNLASYFHLWLKILKFLLHANFNFMIFINLSDNVCLFLG